MKKVFGTKSRIIIVIALVLAAAIALGGVVLSGRSNIFSNLANSVMTPLRQIATDVANKTQDIYAHLYKYDALEAENKLLRQELADMKAEIRDATSLTEENQRLKKLLGVVEDHDDYELVVASVVSYDSSNWNSTFTIGKGSNSGIDTNMCVITEDGNLVGIVTETGLNWSVVTAITDVSTEIGAVVFRTGDIGVAEGDFQLMREGRLKLDYLPTGAELLNGEDVLTSGGELYPQGLVIGTIYDVVQESSGISKYAVIEPSASVDDLIQVFVITYFEE